MTSGHQDQQITYQQLRFEVIKALSVSDVEGVASHTASEAGYLAKLLLTDRLNATEASLMAKRSVSWTDQDAVWLNQSIARLKAHEPWQYVLGKAPFLELEIGVRKGVLIPRPETEEIVRQAILHLESLNLPADQLVCWDACTGSGCIALALKHQFPAADVLATDLSDEALQIAAENAQALHLPIRMLKHDLLQEPSPFAPQTLHLLISNPPYVLPSEAEQMAANVLAYEPAMALFTPEEDPLLFYRVLVRHSLHSLHPQGKVYLECNEAYTDAVVALFRTAGMQATAMKDFRDRWRLVVVGC